MDGIGQLIEAWILATGQTQSDLSTSVGVSQKTISRWKNEETLPQSEYRHTLANALGVDEKTFAAAMRATRTNIDARKRRTVVLPRDRIVAPTSRIDTAQWLAAVMQSADLDLLTRAALAVFCRYVEVPATMQAFVTPRDLVDALPELNADNVDDVWTAILASGYVRPISASGRVFDLVLPE